MSITGLHHVQLAMPPGREGDASAFYSGVLGMVEVEKPPELSGRGGCWFRSGSVDLHLGVEEAFQPARKAHPAFLVDALNEIEQRLQAAGRELQRDADLEGYRRFHTTDPSGNRLEFLERHT